MEKHSIYSVAKTLYSKSSLKDSPLECLVTTISAVLSHISHEEKSSYLEGDAILDYNLYKTEIKKGNFEIFLDDAFEVIPFSNDLTNEQKFSILKETIEDEEGNYIMYYLIAKKLQKDYFPLNDFENYIKAFS